MPEKTAHPPTQFTIRWLLALITLLSAVFAFLGALQVSPTNALVGFAVLGWVTVMTAGIIEAFARLLGFRAK